MSKKGLKLTCLLFAMTFLAGAAFAATNGTLVFGGTVRINNVLNPQVARLEFVSVETWNAPGRTAEIVEVNGRKLLDFEIAANWPPRTPGYSEPTAPPPPIFFEIQNTGTVPVELTGFNVAEGRPFFDITIFRQRADGGVNEQFAFSPWNQMQNDQLVVIAPGEVLIGTIDYWATAFQSEFPAEFDELVFTASVALNYQYAR